MKDFNHRHRSPYSFRARTALLRLLVGLGVAGALVEAGFNPNGHVLPALIGNGLGWTIVTFVFCGTIGAIIGQAWPEQQGPQQRRPQPDLRYGYEIGHFLVTMSLLIASLMLAVLLMGNLNIT